MTFVPRYIYPVGTQMTLLSRAFVLNNTTDVGYESTDRETGQVSDEYPSMRHMGFGMGGRRPAGVYKEVNATRGHFRQLDQTVRRIHLGWEVKVTPNEEGIRVFSGLWYNTTALRKKTDSLRVKVSVFVVPDDITRVTLLIPGGDEPVGVAARNTVFADLTLPEVLETMAAWRKEHPDVTKIYEDRLMQTRRGLLNQRQTKRIVKITPNVQAYAPQAAGRRARSETAPGIRYLPHNTPIFAIQADLQINNRRRAGCD